MLGDVEVNQGQVWNTVAWVQVDHDVVGVDVAMTYLNA